MSTHEKQFSTAERSVESVLWSLIQGVSGVIVHFAGAEVTFFIEVGRLFGGAGEGPGVESGIWVARGLLVGRADGLSHFSVSILIK